MVNIKKKRIIIVMVLFLISFNIFLYYDLENYDEEYVIGKTKDEIIKKYGEFDSILYINNPDKGATTSCGHYAVRGSLIRRIEATVFKLFSGWERSEYDFMYFKVYFNENNIVYSAQFGYIPGK